MRIKIDINLKNLKVSRVIRFFIFTDLLLWGSWGLINPIFAIFIIEKIPGANLVTVGVAASIYWLVKSLLQIPVAVFLDKHEGEKDDFYVLILALILAGFTAMAFALVNTIFWLFAVVFLQAIAFGLYFPSWSAIFSRHLDKEHYAFDWSLDSTTLGLAIGVTALIGGGLAKLFGFQTVFIIVSILSFATAFILFSVPNLILPKVKSKEPLIKDHTPSNIGM